MGVTPLLHFKGIGLQLVHIARKVIKNCLATTRRAVEKKLKGIWLDLSLRIYHLNMNFSTARVHMNPIYPLKLLSKV
ncbi:hypothetical protein E308F_27760 [Moorella sp. E308F]|jgi:hypothetical protein|nr:hypothetical protein E308F_27760 [Moorella sp. E308F]